MSDIFLLFYFLVEEVVLLKPWKMFFISVQKLFSLSSYLNFKILESYISRRHQYPLLNNLGSKDGLAMKYTQFITKENSLSKNSTRNMQS